jgi:hypothetical protein
MRLGALLVVLFGLVGCTCSEKPAPNCVDADQDGVDSCSDCDDADAQRAPGRAEVCDGIDNDCNATVDDGAVCSCAPGSAPSPCGAKGACQQACQASGQLGQCLPPGATSVDTQNDPQHCGQCGASCPVPVHAAARCAEGRCGRGPCQAGFFDVDGSSVFGCEATCAGRTCTLPDGGTLAVSNDPLPEAGGNFTAFAASGSMGDKVQTNSRFTNVGVFGEGVPQGEGGQVEASGGAWRHHGGFTSAVK